MEELGLGKIEGVSRCILFTRLVCSCVLCWGSCGRMYEEVMLIIVFLSFKRMQSSCRVMIFFKETTYN